MIALSRLVIHTRGAESVYRARADGSLEIWVGPAVADAPEDVIAVAQDPEIPSWTLQSYLVHTAQET